MDSQAQLNACRAMDKYTMAMEKNKQKTLMTAHVQVIICIIA